MPQQVDYDAIAASVSGDVDYDALAASVSPPAVSHDTSPKKPEPRTWTDTAVDALPMVGGSVGGLLGMAGGPAGAAAGAALGGAGGEGWRRVIQGARGKRNLAQDSMTEAAGGVALEGGKQAAAEVVGGAIGKGLTKVAPRLYRGLLKPSKAIEQGFGGDDVVKTLMDNGVTISEKGLEKVTGRMADSRGAAMRMVKDAGPGSTFVSPAEVVREFRPVVETLKKRAAIGQTDELAKVGERGRRLVRSLGRGVDAEGAQALKETAQDSASGAYRAMERGGAKQLGAEDLLDEATARGLRKAVESRVPGVAAQNRTTQKLIGGSRALENALTRSRNNLGIGGARDLIAAGVGGSIGGMAGGPAGGALGAGAGILTRLLASPRAGSATAIGLDRVGKHVPIDELLRALQFAMQEPQ